jgi:hypothetical protein
MGGVRLRISNKTFDYFLATDDSSTFVDSLLVLNCTKPKSCECNTNTDDLSKFSALCR